MDNITTTITNLRELYVKEKLNKDAAKYKNLAIECLKTSVNTPLLKEINIQGEEETIQDDMQSIIECIGMDIITINKCLSDIATATDNILTNTIERINDAKATANKAQNTLNNINKICGFYTSFDTIIACDDTSFTGSYGVIDDNTFCCPIASEKSIDITINKISGDGSDLTKESNLIDGDETSYFDYIGSKLNSDVNMVAEISSENKFNLLKVYTDKPLEITSVEKSSDGVVYEDILKQNIKVNGNDVLLNGNYYSLGLICMPTSNYGKIGIQSNEYIHINDLRAKSVSFDTAGTLKSNEITASNITSVGIYATEHIPSTFVNSNCFKYTLIVNGKSYDVVPINSQNNGTKIIKYITDNSQEDSVVGINSKINSVVLLIEMTSESSTMSPFVSNIKFCLGAEN